MELGQHLAATGRRLAANAKHVLDGDRESSQAADRLAALAPCIDGTRLFEGAGFSDVQKRLDLRLALADYLEECSRKGLGRDLTTVQRGDQVGGGAIDHGFAECPNRRPLGGG